MTTAENLTCIHDFIDVLSVQLTNDLDLKKKKKDQLRGTFYVYIFKEG